MRPACTFVLFLIFGVVLGLAEDSSPRYRPSLPEEVLIPQLLEDDDLVRLIDELVSRREEARMRLFVPLNSPQHHLRRPLNNSTAANRSSWIPGNISTPLLIVFLAILCFQNLFLISMALSRVLGK